ncbi:MAG: SDR family oxidoreductase [Alphaproteobacteria bacterium]|nr:SDR family oxidoreductase [Alphaproteobacteria bacterium]
MQGKRGVIMGVANDRSIAWSIAQVAAAQGADLCFTYQGDALLKRLKPLSESLGNDFLLPCDVSDEAALDETFKAIGQKWDSIDFVVHAIAFSDKNELDGRYVNTTRANFLKTMDISCYSFTAVAQRALPLMKNGGSLITLSYLGAERVIPHYNVMGVAKAALEASTRYLAADLGHQGVRVNAISAGPIKTLAASGIGDMRFILRWNELNAPMERNVSQMEVGHAALLLLSDLGSGITGEVLHVDSGYHAIGMINVEKTGEIAEIMTEYSKKAAG